MKSWHTFLRTEVFPQERYGLTKTEQAIFLSKFPSQETVKTNKQVADQAIENDELPSNRETVRKHMWTIYNERFCPKDGKEGFPGYKQRSQTRDQKFLAWLKQRYLQWLETSNSNAPLQSASEANHLIQVSPPALGKLSSHVQDLPLNFLPRINALKDLKKLVFDGRNLPVGVTGTALRVGVQGMGGIGKSVLAAMLARDEEVRHSFPDGILWVTLGQNPTLTLRQLDLAKMLGDTSQMFQDVPQGRVHLSELLANKACLLILDDVWQSKHAEAFNALGQKCKMLITTRDNKVLQELGAVGYLLGLLEDEEALTLLALWAKQEKETLPVEAREVVRECGNLPLALAMIGALVQGKPDRWGNLLHKLHNADLEKIRYQFPDYPYPNLLKAIQVSIEALETEIQKRYLDFAVFPEDTPISETVLQTFWELEGLNEFDTQDVVDVLVERSLARRDDQGCLTLHDLQYNYVRKQAGDLQALHNRFVNSYSSLCSNGWHTGPNDGYFFENLAYHLHKSGRKEELYKLLTKSPDWMKTKYIACTGDAAYIADLELAIEDFNNPLKSNQLLTLIQLYTARQAINNKVTNYNNDDLSTLVWLDREAEALSYARLRADAKDKFDGLVTIYNELEAKVKSNPHLLNEAWETIQEIEDKTIQLEALSDLITIKPEVKTIVLEAETLLAQISDIVKKYLGDGYRVFRLVELQSKLATALVHAGYEQQAELMFTQAEEMAINIQDYWQKPRALKALVVALAEANNFNAAEKVTRLINQDCDKTEALSKLAEILNKKGLAEYANTALTEARKSASLLNGSYRAEIALTELVEALANLGELQQSEEIVWTIKDDLLRSVALVKLVVGLAKYKQFVKAEEVARSIIEYEERKQSLSSLASVLACTGNKEKAKLVFREAEQVTRILKTNWYWNPAVAGLVETLAQGRYFSAAKKLVLMIEEDVDEQQSRALKAIAIALIEDGKFKEAEKITTTIKGSKNFSYALLNLAKSLVKSGYNEGANKFLTDAIEAARTVNDHTDRVCILSDLALAFLEVDNHIIAENLFKEVEELSNTTDHNKFKKWQKVRRLSILGARLSQTDNTAKAKTVFAEAKKITFTIEHWQEKSLALTDCIIGLIEAGYLNEAINLVPMVEETESKVIVLRSLVNKLSQKEYQIVVEQVVQTIKNDRYLLSKNLSEEELAEISAMMAELGYFKEGLKIMGLKPMDFFLSTLTEWVSAFENVELGLSLSVLREAIRISGWVRLDWQQIYEIFPKITNLI
ncbi:NB-ARC domain-containing protein [Nostoc sp. UHCC 0302]|uniref:NB-ARC domain-containing protein n=1 Tax=Nostoc sp. UHCC 0302 TaxID=3134896 RepID=UPI00311C98C9